MAKIDLRDACLTLPIHPDDAKFLRFAWTGVLHYEFRCLPFGLSSASWIITKALKPVAAFLRRRGIRIVIYLDDIMILHQDRKMLLSLVEEVI